MPIQITTAQPLYNFAKNPIWVELFTGIPFFGINSYYRLCFNTGPAVDSVFKITADGFVVALTIVAGMPDDSGEQIPAQSGQILTDYVDMIMDKMQENYYLQDSFTFTRSGFNGGECIIIVAKERGQYNFDVEDGWGAPPPNSQYYGNDGSNIKLNHAAFIEIRDKLNPETPRLPMIAPPDSEGKICFDVSKANNGSYKLPLTNSIAPSSLNYKYAMLSEHMKKYCYVYAEQFGSPARIQSIKEGSDYWVVPGGLKKDSIVNRLTSSVVLYPAHDHVLKNGGNYSNKVSTDQPNWVYILFKQAKQIFVQVVLYFEDGTTAAEQVLAPTNFAANTFWYFTTGYDQLKRHFFNPDDLVPYRYTVSIVEQGTDTYYHTFSYEIECGCQPWNTHLLFQNGVGGVESVLFSGKSEERFKATREVIEKAVSKDFNISDGQHTNFNQVGRTLLEFSTGWCDADDMYYLRQLLMSECWLIDTVYNRFLKLNIESTEIIVNQDDQNLYDFQLKARFAWTD